MERFSLPPPTAALDSDPTPTGILSLQSTPRNCANNPLPQHFSLSPREACDVADGDDDAAAATDEDPHSPPILLAPASDDPVASVGTHHLPLTTMLSTTSTGTARGELSSGAAPMHPHPSSPSNRSTAQRSAASSSHPPLQHHRRSPPPAVRPLGAWSSTTTLPQSAGATHPAPPQQSSPQKGGTLRLRKAAQRITQRTTDHNNNNNSAAAMSNAALLSLRTKELCGTLSSLANVAHAALRMQQQGLQQPHLSYPSRDRSNGNQSGGTTEESGGFPIFNGEDMMVKPLSSSMRAAAATVATAAGGRQEKSMARSFRNNSVLYEASVLSNSTGGTGSGHPTSLLHAVSRQVVPLFLIDGPLLTAKPSDLCDDEDEVGGGGLFTALPTATTTANSSTRGPRPHQQSSPTTTAARRKGSIFPVAVMMRHRFSLVAGSSLPSDPDLMAVNLGAGGGTLNRGSTATSSYAGGDTAATDKLYPVGGLADLPESDPMEEPRYEYLTAEEKRQQAIDKEKEDALNVEMMPIQLSLMRRQAQFTTKKDRLDFVAAVRTAQCSAMWRVIQTFLAVTRRFAAALEEDIIARAKLKQMAPLCAMRLRQKLKRTREDAYLLAAEPPSLDVLKGDRTLSHFPEEHLAQLRHSLRLRFFFMGEALWYAGAQDDLCFVIEKGFVSVRKPVGEQIVSTHRRNQVIGSLGMIAGEVRTTNVIAKTPVLAWVLTRAQFLEHLQTEEPRTKNALQIVNELRQRNIGEVYSALLAPKSLRSFLLFHELEEHVLESFVGGATPCVAKRGTVLLRAGTEAETALLVLRGRVRLSVVAHAPLTTTRTMQQHIAECVCLYQSSHSIHRKGGGTQHGISTRDDPNQSLLLQQQQQQQHPGDDLFARSSHHQALDGTSSTARYVDTAEFHRPGMACEVWCPAVISLPATLQGDGRHAFRVEVLSESVDAVLLSGEHLRELLQENPVSRQAFTFNLTCLALPFIKPLSKAQLLKVLFPPHLAFDFLGSMKLHGIEQVPVVYAAGDVVSLEPTMEGCGLVLLKGDLDGVVASTRDDGSQMPLLWPEAAFLYVKHAQAKSIALTSVEGLLIRRKHFIAAIETLKAGHASTLKSVLEARCAGVTTKFYSVSKAVSRRVELQKAENAIDRHAGRGAPPRPDDPTGAPPFSFSPRTSITAGGGGFETFERLRTRPNTNNLDGTVVVTDLPRYPDMSVPLEQLVERRIETNRLKLAKQQQHRPHSPDAGGSRMTTTNGAARPPHPPSEHHHQHHPHDMISDHHAATTPLSPTRAAMAVVWPPARSDTAFGVLPQIPVVMHDIVPNVVSTASRTMMMSSTATPPPPPRPESVLPPAGGGPFPTTPLHHHPSQLSSIPDGHGAVLHVPTALWNSSFSRQQHPPPPPQFAFHDDHHHHRDLHTPPPTHPSPDREVTDGSTILWLPRVASHWKERAKLTDDERRQEEDPLGHFFGRLRVEDQVGLDGATGGTVLDRLCNGEKNRVTMRCARLMESRLKQARIDARLSNQPPHHYSRPATGSGQQGGQRLVRDTSDSPRRHEPRAPMPLFPASPPGSSRGAATARLSAMTLLPPNSYNGSRVGTASMMMRTTSSSGSGGGDPFSASSRLMKKEMEARSLKKMQMQQQSQQGLQLTQTSRR